MATEKQYLRWVTLRVLSLFLAANFLLALTFFVHISLCKKYSTLCSSKATRAFAKPHQRKRVENSRSPDKDSLCIPSVQPESLTAETQTLHAHHENHFVKNLLSSPQLARYPPPRS